MFRAAKRRFFSTRMGWSCASSPYITSSVRSRKPGLLARKRQPAVGCVDPVHATQENRGRTST